MHVAPLVLVHPVHDEKAFPPAVPGAVNVTVVPELYVRAKLVVPFPELLLSAGDTAIATPLAGFAESTVSTYVAGGTL